MSHFTAVNKNKMARMVQSARPMQPQEEEGAIVLVFIFMYQTSMVVGMGAPIKSETLCESHMFAKEFLSERRNVRNRERDR